MDNLTKVQLQELVAQLEEREVHSQERIKPLNVMCEWREQEIRDAVGQEKQWRNSAQSFSGDSKFDAGESVRLTELSEQLNEKIRQQDELAQQEAEDKAEALALADKRAGGSRAGGQSNAKTKEESIELIQSLFKQAADKVTAKPKHKDSYRKNMCDMVSRLYRHAHDPVIHTTYKVRKNSNGEHAYNRVFGAQFNIWMKANKLT